MWIKNGFFWKWWSIGIPCVCKKFQDDAWSIRKPCSQCKASIYMYTTMWRGTTWFFYLCIKIGSTGVINLNQVILGFGRYIPSEKALTKKKRTMHCWMINTRKLKLRCYVACMVDLNEYLTIFLGRKASEDVSDTW